MKYADFFWTLAQWTPVSTFQTQSSNYWIERVDSEVSSSSVGVVLLSCRSQWCVIMIECTSYYRVEVLPGAACSMCSSSEDCLYSLSHFYHVQTFGKFENVSVLCRWRSVFLNTFWGKDQRPEIWGRGSLLENGGFLAPKSSSISGKYPPS